MTCFKDNDTNSVKTKSLIYKRVEITFQDYKVYRVPLLHALLHPAIGSQGSAGGLHPRRGNADRKCPSESENQGQGLQGINTCKNTKIKLT